MNENERKAAMAALCQSHLDILAIEGNGILAALVATSDGFHLASIKSEIGEERLAAMSSSMHALGDQIATEASLKQHQNVLIETATGKVLMLNIPTATAELILTVVANDSMTFGMLLFACRQSAERIGSALNNMA
jgi:predicted regulator of Ras-like GTPase activity (Roadblock/LC7/MglB family)